MTVQLQSIDVILLQWTSMTCHDFVSVRLGCLTEVDLLLLSLGGPALSHWDCKLDVWDSDWNQSDNLFNNILSISESDSDWQTQTQQQWLNQSMTNKMRPLSWLSGRSPSMSSLLIYYFIIIIFYFGNDLHLLLFILNMNNLTMTHILYSKHVYSL